MNKIDRYIDRLEAKIPKFQTTNEEISNASVGWHIEHTLLTLNGITNQLIKSNPNDYKWNFSLIKIIVFTMGKIPRGRAQTPEVVKPKGDISVEGLVNHIETSRQKTKELQFIRSGKFFKHPIFGKLKLKDTVKFLEIHTKHHLEIIEDILK